jgi:RNA polymerase sigma-54 factor
MQSSSQHQKQSQHLKILPQQIQFLNLLQLNAAELEGYVEKELEENPFLEEGQDAHVAGPEVEATDAETDTTEDFDEPSTWEGMDDEETSYQAQTEGGFTATEEKWQATEVQHDSFRDELKRQAHFMDLTAPQRDLVDYLVDSLDESGFLRFSVDNIVDDFAFTRSQIITNQQVEEAIGIVQSLDPAGICARDVRECLMLQLSRLKHHKRLKEWATRVIDQYLPQLAAHHYDPIMKALGIESDEMSFVIDLVRSLNPKPLQGMADDTDTTIAIRPDFLVEAEGDTLVASVLNIAGASVRISPDADDYLKTYKDKAAKVFVRQKVDDARWLIEALRQRNDTLLRTIQIIVTLQKAYFTSGDEALLKPMILRDIAEKVNLDVSTISRITSTKHVQTNFGIIPLKDLFFQTFTGQDGRELTNREVQEVLAEIVAAEDKTRPLNDSQIQEILQSQGFAIARRTVAKYRDAMQIPIADQRRELS